jgi:hypothetical protein
MILKGFLEWVKTLPEEFLEFTMVNAERLDKDDDEIFIRYDKPIMTITVDEENKEICFLNIQQKHSAEEN